MPEKRVVDCWRSRHRDCEVPAPEFPKVLRSIAKASALLVALRDGTRYKSELADETGVSKSTIYNWTSELEGYGLVRKSSSGYELTTLGSLHLHLYFEWRSFSQRLYRSEPLLEELPAEFDIPVEMLKDATLVPVRPDPDAPMEAYLDHVERVDSLVALLPVVNSRLIAHLRSQLADGALELELAVSEDVFAHVEAAYPDFIEAILIDDLSRVVTVADPPSIGIGIGRGATCEAVMLPYTPHGHLAGALSLAGSDAIRLAQQLYNEYTADGEPVVARALSEMSPSDHRG